MFNKPDPKLLDLALVRIHNTLERPENWCKGTYHDAATGAHCLVGAQSDVQRDLSFDIENRMALTTALYEAIKRYGKYKRLPTFIARWNDRKSTKHKDVLAVIEKAREVVRERYP